MTLLFISTSASRARSFAFVSACLAATSLTHPALAQNAGSQLPEITVTSPTLVPTPVEQIASSITVITKEDLERDQRRSAGDALQAVPGLNIVQSGGPGSLTEVYMRGASSNHTKILIDGIDVSDPSNPNNVFDLGQLTTADIERIEVLRGPQSGLYGSDAIGGVISITTKKGQGPAKVTAMVEGGSHGTINAATGVSGSQDKFNYALNVSRYETNSSPVTPLDLLPPGQKRINDSYVNKTVSTKLGYDFSEYFGLNFTGRYTNSDLFFTNTAPNGFDPADLQSEGKTKQYATRTEAVVNLFDGRFKNYFGVNYTNQNNWHFEPYPFPGNTTDSRNVGERLKYDWRGVIDVIAGQTVVLGADQQKEKFDLFGSNGTNVKAENGNKGAFAELQSNFSNRFFVTSNVRVDDNDQFGEHSTYRIAPAFIVPGTDTKLKGSYGTGFKAPTLSQLYDTTFGAFSPNNPNLRPEESTGYDAGFEQPLFNNHVRFGTTYFHNDFRNLIAFTSAFMYDNIRSARASGFENFLAVVFSDQFRVRFDYTFTDTKIIENPTPTILTRRPRDKFTYSAVWDPTKDLSLSATLIATGKFDDVTRAGPPFVVNRGYKIVNIAANYTVVPGVVAFARVDNLFDQQYQEATGFLNPGFGVFGGIRLASAPLTK